MVSYAYLGPEGTFTEAALRRVADAGAELVPYETVTAALDAVRATAVAGAMVPLENSVEGSVNATLDELAAGAPLVIVREVVIPVAFSLVARPGTQLADIKKIATHPHAEAQTRRWLAANLPAAVVLPATSTAAAAAQVADPTAPFEAAIAAPIAVEHYPLVALATGIGDNSDAVTRFVLVEPPGHPPPRTGQDRTSLVFFLRDDHPGALLESLEQFAARGVNLTRIESRPTGDGIGRYCFSVDLEGHIADARVGDALKGLRRVSKDVRFLGSYERADGIEPDVRYGTADADFASAEEWLRALRGGN